MGLDLDQTIDKNPEFYKILLENWKCGYRFLITGRPWTEQEITKHQLENYGILELFDGLHFYQGEYIFYRGKHLKDTRNKVSMFDTFEDRIFECEELTKEGKEIYLDHEELSGKIREWKLAVIQDLGVNYMIDDNEETVKLLKSKGIYTLRA